MANPKFFYSAKTYNLRTLKEDYGHKLPVMIEFTEGCLAENEGIDFSTGDVLFLYQITNKSRARCVDSQQRHFTIPVSYPNKFVVIKHTNLQGVPVKKNTKKSSYLSDILVTWKPGHELYLKMEDIPGNSFCINADFDCPTRMEQLRILGVYEELYFIGCPVLEEELYEEAQVLPIYLDLQLVVLTGMTEDNHTFGPKWLTLCRNFAEYVRRFDVGNLNYNKEIAELPSDIADDEDENEYKYISPQHFIYNTISSAGSGLGNVIPRARGASRPPIPDFKPPPQNLNLVKELKELHIKGLRSHPNRKDEPPLPPRSKPGTGNLSGKKS